LDLDLEGLSGKGQRKGNWGRQIGGLFGKVNNWFLGLEGSYYF